MKRIKIAHLTSAHPRYDTRIFVKECRSLAEVYEVTLVVADGLGDEVKDSVRIIDVGKPQDRRERVLKTTRRILNQAKAVDADLYHFHDPELLPIGFLLRRMGKMVVYDAHEDLPRQILAKTYIPFWLHRPLAWWVEKIENMLARSMSAVVVPTPLISERFSEQGIKTAQVRNFPILEEVGNNTSWEERSDTVCYIGAIARSRGIEEMVKAMVYCSVPLELGGDFRPRSLRNEIALLEGWHAVHHYGFVNRDEVQAILSKSKIGLVTLHPTDSYLEAIPVKLFEYMAAGIPFIASDFPFWRSLLKECECGLFVDPMDPAAIGEAINMLMKDQELAKRLGSNGKAAIETHFGWEHESRTLQALYRALGDATA